MVYPSKKRYDAKMIVRVTTSLHRVNDSDAVHKLEELQKQGRSRSAYVREAIKEKVERDMRGKEKE